VKDILDTRIEECGFRSMTYNCLKKSGIKTLRDLKVFVEYKGIKGLYHIEKLNGHMRDEVKDLIYHYDFK
jgi:DNA-directed RNA polymerase alpha subunit